jgi:hypothetical protein
MDNALDPQEMTHEARLDEVARLLAEGLQRHRLRHARNTMNINGLGEKHLEDGRMPSTHGLELSRKGDREP